MWDNVTWVNVNKKRAASGSLLEKQNLWYYPDLVNQNQYLNKIFRWCIHMSNFENYCSRISSIHITVIGLIFWKHWEHPTSQSCILGHHKLGKHLWETSCLYPQDSIVLPFSESPSLPAFPLNLSHGALVILIMVIVITAGNNNSDGDNDDKTVSSSTYDVSDTL